MSSAYQTGQRVRVRKGGDVERRFWGRAGVIERVDDHRNAGALQVAYMILLDGEPAARCFLANDVEVAAGAPPAKRPPQRAVARKGEDWWSAEEAENGWVPSDATWGEQPDDDDRGE